MPRPRIKLKKHADRAFRTEKSAALKVGEMWYVVVYHRITQKHTVLLKPTKKDAEDAAKELVSPAKYVLVCKPVTRYKKVLVTADVAADVQQPVAVNG